MKKLLVVLACMIAVGSCSKESVLKVDHDIIDYPVKGGTYDINIVTEAGWEAVSGSEWVSVTPETGNGDSEITIIVDEWTDEEKGEKRTATIVVTSMDGASVDITVNQYNDDNKLPGPPDPPPFER